jgi:hypothetical protein
LSATKSLCQTADSGGSRLVFRDDGAPLFRLMAAQGSD